MLIDVKLTAPKPIYDIYADAVKQRKGYSVEDALCAAALISGLQRQK